MFPLADILGVIALLLLAGLAVVLVAAHWPPGVSRDRRQGQSLALPVKDGDTALDRAAAPLTAAHPGESGLMLLTSSIAAFHARRETVRGAGRSLDLQYYFWKNDLTGRLLLGDVMDAAARGVRVRLLLDDINSFGFDPWLLALDSHPNVEVRLFNPSRSRTNTFRRGLEIAVKYFTATRRMHNKCWIADGRVLIAGGRNIGDEYFDASQHANFHDIDVLALGQCVADAQTVFDRYWNSEPALPIRLLHKIRRLRRPRWSRLTRRIARFNAAPDAQRLLEHLAAQPGLAGIGDRLPLHWTSDVDVIADPPEKASGQSQAEWMGERVNELLRTAQTSLLIGSPYFIPGSAGSKTLAALAASGRSIRVLTNSLAATDVIAVHGAYARYRKQLVAAGIELHELKPEPRRHRASLFGSRTASLHTKAFVVDEELGFVGSFNLDPRSHSINTEMGLLFRCPPLVQQLKKAFETQMSTELSYSLSLREGRLVWTETRQGHTIVHLSEPEAPLRRLIPAWFIAWLPIESQL